MGPGWIWKPFDLDESAYLEILERLENMTAMDLQLRHRDPEIEGELRADHSAPDTDDYIVWLRSLNHRSLSD
jgi:hypothetical protein